MTALTVGETYGTLIPIERVKVFLIFDSRDLPTPQYKLIFWQDNLAGFRVLRNGIREDLVLGAGVRFFSFLDLYLNGQYTVHGIAELEPTNYARILNRAQLHAADYPNNKRFYEGVFDDLVATYGTQPQPSPGNQLYDILRSWLSGLRGVVVLKPPTLEREQEQQELQRIIDGLKIKHPGLNWD